jgi:hypothetical protein
MVIDASTQTNRTGGGAMNGNRCAGTQTSPYCGSIEWYRWCTRTSWFALAENIMQILPYSFPTFGIEHRLVARKCITM